MTQTPSHYDATGASGADPSGGFDVQVGDDLQASSPAGSSSFRGSALSGTGSSSFDDVSPTSGADSATGNGSSTTDTAKQEAGKVADTGVQAAKDVAGTAKDEASNVIAETTQQAKSLFESARSELTSQGGAQQQKLATTLHSFAEELGGMASGSDQSGPLTDLAKQAAQKGGEFADWLENHEPADLLREVQTFARRRPVAFLALCGLAGVVAGRIARGATAANTSLDSGSTGSAPRLAERPVDTDGAGLGYSDLLGSTPEVTTGYASDANGSYGGPTRAAYDSNLDATGTAYSSYDSDPTRPGEPR